MNAAAETNFRDRIAGRIAISVITATGILGVIGVILAALYIVKDKDGKGMDQAMDVLQFIFSALLPLWGTWIGTVLAYYFSKENFEAANKQVRELVSQVTAATEKLKAKKAMDAIMPFNELIKQEIPTGKTADDFVVETLYADLQKNSIRRSLIFEGKKIVLVLHKSLLSDFLFRNNANPDVNKLTVGHMRKDPDKDIQNAFLNGVATVATDATLLDVKSIMDVLPGCQDVFVTSTGKKNGDVIGWLTNVEILNELRD